MTLMILLLGAKVAIAQKAEQNYAMYCGACHGTKITESKLNSLVKKEWKHGSDKTSIMKSITDGISNTQMITWKGVLSTKEIEELTEFILNAQPQKAPIPKRGQRKPNQK